MVQSTDTIAIGNKTYNTSNTSLTVPSNGRYNFTVVASDNIGRCGTISNGHCTLGKYNVLMITYSNTDIVRSSFKYYYYFYKLYSREFYYYNCYSYYHFCNNS